MTGSLPRRCLAEALGTALLLATVVGSGIMGERLANGNLAIALLANSLATGAMLVVLILIFASVSGAQFNPVVSLAFALRRELPWREAAFYMPCQLAGAILGVWIAHIMFNLPVIELSRQMRGDNGQWVSEAVATFGLVVTILGCRRCAPAATSYAVGLYITAAYWFTASTSFANPAVTVARALTDTFAGIAWNGIAGFVAAELAGMALALAAAHLFWCSEPLEALASPRRGG